MSTSAAKPDVRVQLEANLVQFGVQLLESERCCWCIDHETDCYIPGDAYKAEFPKANHTKHCGVCWRRGKPCHFNRAEYDEWKDAQKAKAKQTRGKGKQPPPPAEDADPEPSAKKQAVLQVGASKRQKAVVEEILEWYKVAGSVLKPQTPLEQYIVSQGDALMKRAREEFGVQDKTE